MVVDNHAGNPINFLSSLFPYNSFFMPLFVFISGYFFNEVSVNNIASFIKIKFKNLFFPYIIHNFIFGILFTIIFSCIDISWHFSKKFIFFDMITTGIIADITSASWFIIMLFFLNIIYLLIRKLFYNIWNDFLFFFIFILTGCISIYNCRIGNYSNLILLPILKISFFLQFYQLGVIYNKLECYINLKNKLLLIIIASCCTLSILLQFYFTNEQLCFNRLAFMDSFNTDFLLLPLITSCIGIFFYLSLSIIISRNYSNSKLINLISNNTLTILTTHLLFFNFFNIILLFIYNNSSIENNFNE